MNKGTFLKILSKKHWRLSAVSANKEIVSRAGIYCIYCLQNGNMYIGASTKLESRKKQHFSLLRSGRHQNTALQSDFLKFGEESFALFVIEYIDEKCISKESIEAYYMAFVEPASRLYNLHKKDYARNPNHIFLDYLHNRVFPSAYPNLRETK